MDQPFPRPDEPAITRPPTSPPPLPAGAPAGRTRDPGSTRAALIGGILAFVLILGVAVVQQSGWSAVKQTGQAAPATQTAIAPPPVLFDVMARIYVKLNALEAGTGGQASPSTGMIVQNVVPELENQAKGAADQVRIAIVQAELADPEGAVKRLTETRDSLPADSPLAEDADDLIDLYNPVAEGEERAALEQAVTDRLVDHHAWFGKVAATYGRPMSEPLRQEAAGGGTTMMLALLAILAWFGTAFLAGLVLLIVAIVKLANGTLRFRFVPPAPGGSVAIETVAAFAGGFLLLKTVAEIVGVTIGKTDQTLALYFTLSVQWLLALLILWPVARGVRLRESLALFGLHRGRGILREIGCGIMGYLACLPLFGLGVVISLVLVVIQGVVERMLGRKPAPPGNDIVDLVGRANDPGVLVLLFVLATVWAPLVEETIFRGALFRHLRSRWPLVPAALATALAFGVMHSYAVPLLFPVLMLGFGFSLLREWRGSIIAPMTGHCLHNATALGAMLVVTKVLGL